MRQKGFVVIPVLLVLLLLGIIGYSAYKAGYLNISPLTTSVKTNDSSSEINTETLQSRFNSTNDDLQDETDPKTQWKKFTSNDYYISFLYPPILTRNSQWYWSDPPNISAMERPRVYMSLGEVFAYLNSSNNLDTLDKLTQLNIGEEHIINQGNEREYTLIKTGEKTSGNFSGFVYKDKIQKKSYFNPSYYYLFISDFPLSPLDARIAISIHFNTPEERDKFSEDFLKIVNSASFVDFDMQFLQQLGLTNKTNDIKFVKSNLDEGIFILNKADSSFDHKGEVFQIEEGHDKFIGYVVSRKINLKDNVGKRMIIKLRKIDGINIDNKEVFFIDDVNVI